MTVSQRVDDLLVETSGQSDEVLLLVHGAVTIDGCRPLLEHARDRYRVVHYYRRGYAGSAAPPSGFSIQDQAHDARRVLRAMGVQRAHVLGHSIGATIALQLALETPAEVQSLVLVEPTSISRPGLRAWFQEAMAPVVAAYTAGDIAGATDLMLRLIDGEDYRRMYGAVFAPGWFETMAAAMDLYFGVELPAAVQWMPPSDIGEIIQHDVLIVNGEQTLSQFRMIADDLRTSLPNATIALVPGATHNAIASRPAESAAILARLLERGPVAMPKALRHD